MGYLVGGLLRTGLDTEARSYLRSFVQPVDADLGEPISVQDHQRWLISNAAAFERFGWRMERIEVDLLPEATRLANDFDRSKPDPFVRVVARGEVSGHEYAIMETDFHTDTDRGEWQPEFVVYDGDSFEVQVVDHDLSSNLGLFNRSEQSFGAVCLSARAPIPTSIAPEPDAGRYWSATIAWAEVHH